MSATFFYQECPTCGRALKVRVNYLGKMVICEHCKGSFMASDPTNPQYEGLIQSSLDRADELLAKVSGRPDWMEMIER